MSVQYVKGSNPFGTLGMLANIGGIVTGQPWLTALGQGMNAFGQFSNGYTSPGFQNTNNNPMNWLGGLMAGNIATNNPDQTTQRGK